MENNLNPKKEKSLAFFSRRAVQKISRTWERFVSLTRLTLFGKLDPDLEGVDGEHIQKMISACLSARGGEISSREKAVELGKIYLGLSLKGREKFLMVLAREFDVDLKKIDEIRAQFQDPGNEEKRIRMEIKLAEALVTPRVRLLKQFNSLPNGFKFLIDFRADLLAIRGKDPHLLKLDADLKDILASWFDVGLLDLRAITWESPASLLEKLIQYEAVHAIPSWEDLKKRLTPDRMCFAFFHNKVPDEPLVFVEVALVNSISDSIQKLLDRDPLAVTGEDKADTAIFYSISNAEKGLAGINLGNFLIKSVVEELQKKFKNLKHFATLSPIPGFRKWLDPLLRAGDETILSTAEIQTLKKESTNSPASGGLLEMLDSGWTNDPEASRMLKPIMMRLCARYLLLEKRNGKVLDPVANFHLTNGARIERLNWLGDTSEKALKQSVGMMVNYYYKLSAIDENQKLYLEQSRIRSTKNMRKWL